MGRMRRFWMVAGPAVVVHVSAGAAWAQKEARVPDEEDGWLKFAVAFGLAVVICTTGFINAKRSHLT